MSLLGLNDEPPRERDLLPGCWVRFLSGRMGWSVYATPLSIGAFLWELAGRPGRFGVAYPQSFADIWWHFPMWFAGFGAVIWFKFYRD